MSDDARSASSSDFYGDENDTSPACAPIPALQQYPVFSTVAAAPPDVHQDLHATDNGDDSSSEMDMSEPSRPATPVPSDPATSAPTVAATRVGAKRKLSDAGDTDHVEAVAPGDLAKKRKMSNSPVQGEALGSSIASPVLPVEVWQRVFLHLPPAMLCRCLRVCKDFRSYLTDMKASTRAKRYGPAIQTTDSEAIWIQSRKTYFPVIPRPLARFSEHAMLKLVGGVTCQFCGRKPTRNSATSHLNAGPGPDGLRVLWPFGIRSCGLCLEPRVLKDVQVLSDPRFGSLRLGVPHGYRSPDLHFASESIRQLPGGIPGNLRFSKINYIPDLEAVKAEEEDAKTLGNGAVNEWRKGLSARGKEAMADSARWEKWELQLRPGANLAQVLREYDASSFPRLVGDAQGRSAGVNGAQPTQTVNDSHPLPQPVHVFAPPYGLPPQPLLPHLPPQQQFLRPVRNLQEVEMARQTRRAEIERRCRELVPPLEPNVLQHMESFQAAMQITHPLTEQAWEMLKPRILAQREAAELAEHERASQLAALRAALPPGAMDEFATRSAKDGYDREYEQAQEPLRKRLSEYADDYVNGQWNGGKLLNRDNAPIFAIHVMMHVQRRYAEDKQLDLLPRFEPPKIREGIKQNTPPLEPFLSLDNMKWIHDNKVRPLTDAHRRELFLCDGCDEEKKPKWFAFEGLIQHYGAKHTTTFSKGNIVVHWPSAQWPDPPPFHANPAHWLRLDHRTSENKSQARTRSTPHNSHDGPFVPPGSRAPEHRYPVANGMLVTNAAYNPVQSVSPLPQPSSNGYFHPQAPPPEPNLDFTHDTQLNKLATDALEIWDYFDGVVDLEESIRLYIVIHHASLRFVEQFQWRPKLDLLTDALATNPLLRPLKNIHGLACKSCIAANTNGTSSQDSYWARIRGAKLYSTSSLITHFKLMHLSHDPAGFLDWTRDMIELPEHKIVQQLLRAPGMDDDKLGMVARAFPGAFPTPLPRIGLVADQSIASMTESVSNSLLDRLSKKQKNPQKRKNKDTRAMNGHIGRDDSQEPLPEPTEDEYDPRRPMFLPFRPERPDESRVNANVLAPSVVPAAPPAGMLSLDSETLAALQNLSTPGNASMQHPHDRARSRSPSVGCQAPSSRQDPSGSVLTPTGQPDIAAILASLTGQAATVQAAPSAAMSTSRADSAARPVHADAYNSYQYGSPGAPHRENERHSSRYGSHEYLHDALPASGSVHELQEALSRNTRHIVQNQHHTYVETPYVPALAPAHYPGTRLHHVYESDQRYTQPPPHVPSYRETPVQYVQLPEREQAYRPYQYDRAPPQPIYVDQYGRPLELIPIDTPSGPVQYTPSHYEQQYQPVYTSVGPTAHVRAVYEDRRTVYHSNGVQHRYEYDEGRASVPRS